MNTTPTFDQFWQAYPLRKGKRDAERPWNRLSAKDKRAAIAGIAAYVADCEQRHVALKYPQGYLSGRRWEDDLEAAPLHDEDKQKTDNCQEEMEIW